LELIWEEVEAAASTDKKWYRCG